MWLWTVIIALSVGAAPAAKPFWQTKPKAIERIKNREILVVVKSAPKNEGKMLIARGGGRVNAPADFTFQRALEFDQLPKLSGYIEEAVFNEKAQELTVKVGAYGYHGKMRIKLDIRDKSNPREIGFNVVEGSLKGFNGLFRFEPLASKISEVGLEGNLVYEKISLPKVFLEFGMEVVLQRLAGKLRRFAEDEYKKQEKSEK
jgi:hypothetical protein